MHATALARTARRLLAAAALAPPRLSARLVDEAEALLRARARLLELQATPGTSGSRPAADPC